MDLGALHYFQRNHILNAAHHCSFWGREKTWTSSLNSSDWVLEHSTLPDFIKTNQNIFFQMGGFDIGPMK